MKTNGESNNYWLNAGVAMAIGLVISSVSFGWFYAKTKKGDEAITVTGAAKKRIKSDLVIWSAGVSVQAPQLTDAYRQLSDSIPRIKQYLVGKGIPEAQMTVSSITTTTLKKQDDNGNETSVVTGYSLRQPDPKRASVKANLTRPWVCFNKFERAVGAVADFNQERCRGSKPKGNATGGWTKFIGQVERLALNRR